MRTYFFPWHTSTANVTKPFLRKPAHPVRLNIGTLQNLPSCFHTIRFNQEHSKHSLSTPITKLQITFVITTIITDVDAIALEELQL